MRFSILLPTRNRLEYLKLAVESVLRQDFQDWQLVVSDNFSDQDIERHLSALEDPRIVFRRTERFVPVTENWNRALAHSDGEYIIMLGDDDALLGGYLRRMDELIGQFSGPDVIYAKSLLFTYPGVDPERPAGCLMDHGCAEFFATSARPFVLDRSTALELVRSAMSFRMRYDFNAQFALISRSLIESLRSYGDFYQSEFPDYYSINAAFLRAHRIVVDPSPGVVIGVTPKSYGYFHINHMEPEGRSFLYGAAAEAPAGANVRIGWLSAATALEHGVGGDFGLRVDHRRCRFIQVAYAFQRYLEGRGDRAELLHLVRGFPLLERWIYGAAAAAFALLHRVLAARSRQVIARIAARRLGQRPARITPWTVEGAYRDVLEVCDKRSPSQRPGSALERAAQRK
jgi:glycosyltransferase involved in cell wall biosynthesis